MHLTGIGHGLGVRACDCCPKVFSAIYALYNAPPVIAALSVTQTAKWMAIAERSSFMLSARSAPPAASSTGNSHGFPREAVSNLAAWVSFRAPARVVWRRANVGVC